MSISVEVSLLTLKFRTLKDADFFVTVFQQSAPSGVLVFGKLECQIPALPPGHSYAVDIGDSGDRDYPVQVRVLSIPTPKS